MCVISNKFLIRLILNEISKYSTKANTNAKTLIFVEKLKFMWTQIAIHENISFMDLETLCLWMAKSPKSLLFRKFDNLIGFQRNSSIASYNFPNLIKGLYLLCFVSENVKKCQKQAIYWQLLFNICAELERPTVFFRNHFTYVYIFLSFLQATGNLSS